MGGETLFNPLQGSLGQWLAVGRHPGCLGLFSGRDAPEEKGQEQPDPLTSLTLVSVALQHCPGPSWSRAPPHACFPQGFGKGLYWLFQGSDGGKTTLDSIVVIDFVNVSNLLLFFFNRHMGQEVSTSL